MKRCYPSKNTTHAYNTLIVDIVYGKNKDALIYHYKYPNSSYILITVELL